MKWYRPEENDVIKIIPIIKHDGSVVPFYDTVGVFIKNTYVFDDLNKRHLIRIWNKYKANGKKDVQLMKRAYFQVLVNDDVKFMPSPNSLTDVILSSGVDFRRIDDISFHIRKDMRSAGHMKLPSYENTKVVKAKWDEVGTDMYEWIKSKQPFYIEEHFAKNNIFKHMDLIKEAFGEELIREVIADDRDRKINDIID